MEDWDLAPATSAITSTRRSSSRMVDTIEEAEMIVVTGADADAAELMVEAGGRAVRDGDAATEDRGDGTKASLWDTRSVTKEKTTATSGGSIRSATKEKTTATLGGLMRGPDDLAHEEDDENDSVRYGTDLLLLRSDF